MPRLQLTLLGGVQARTDAGPAVTLATRKTQALLAFSGPPLGRPGRRAGAGEPPPSPYPRTGDQAKAQEHLTTAATMYREMDMGFWLEKAKLGPPPLETPCTGSSPLNLIS
jgi:hypothetical protein